MNESRVLESDLIAVQEALWGVLQSDGSRTGGLGYNTGAFEGFTHKSESKKGIFKLDWNINDNKRLAIIYNFLNASKEKPAHPTAIAFRGPSQNTLQFQNSGYEINNKLKPYIKQAFQKDDDYWAVFSMHALIEDKHFLNEQ